MFDNKETFKTEFIQKLQDERGKSIDHASHMDLYKTLGKMVKEQINHTWVKSNQQMSQEGNKEVHYLSMEFLLGRMLEQNLLNLGVLSVCQKAFDDLNIDFEQVVSKEPDPGLGNGGLGRLAADFMDSLSAMALPGHGHCLRYKYGLFDQKIVNGYQVEVPGNWLREGNIWEIRRSDHAVEVKFGGTVEAQQQDGRTEFVQRNYECILAVPYDVPILGYDQRIVNTLKLWNTEPAVQDFHFESVNTNSCHKVANYKKSIESISEFLYPDDSGEEGQNLRLKQQYFLVSAGLQSIINNFKLKERPIEALPEEVSIHLNDTHPVLAIPELMRILIDNEKLDWDTAWDITQRTTSFTNHTTLPEALESWSTETLRCLLPRIFMIIEEINERFCKSLWDKFPGEWEHIEDMAVIAQNKIEMAHLAIVGSHSINGVAGLHTDIIKDKLFKNFHDIMPEKFNNKTNGITHRRWLMLANSRLADIVTEAIGAEWIEDPKKLVSLQDHATDSALQDKFASQRRNNKEHLADLIKTEQGLDIDPDSIFDVLIKRIHGYKRQLMKALYILKLYNYLKENPRADITPRTFIFSGKAAPGYQFAKKVIKLITSIGDVVNNDPEIGGKIKVVFMENYRVSLAEQIIPASDVNEQISTASKEASGTGNMKFIMNGSIIIGTMDGANIDIHKEVGDDNIFTFGLEPKEVIDYYHHGGYEACDVYEKNPDIKEVLDMLKGHQLSEQESFNEIYDHLLLENDEFFVLKDLPAYSKTQHHLEQAYKDRSNWLTKCLINVAHSGKFSSDYTIQKYADEIWNLNKVTPRGATKEETSLHGSKSHHPQFTR